MFQSEAIDYGKNLSTPLSETLKSTYLTFNIFITKFNVAGNYFKKCNLNVNSRL